ncbi:MULTISPECIES: pitrilysin family protein [unclassified Shewanella]|uniref:M16 family metallopeptidase n=1 Tax=unclassified Shewanella TaxID=196818 RepID=UPI000C85DDA3|nr:MULTISPECIES: pitrilysin family protein [unclassified Shewanella]MDO6619872.1 pitrilysin family protein [Shewanella sp. 6_MG-2023]PMG27026.1 peptidase M16 [Shewanella sp. 10N.286.52.C2]PMG44439.1 peptidase M16 [Shewanella sp. 10N.286.52.B9]PMH87166.1 peptidase M16 [Shewanella sp. 10N.286.48.B5]
MKKWILAAAISIAISGCAHEATISPALPQGVTLVETVAQSDSVGIPYKKYQLENGLTVILHQDTSDPLVHVDVTYHVGSAREVAGRSGFAHLFEHMMFQGSQNVGDEQHFKVVTEAGGTLNGTTNTDRTNYFETVPSNQLEKMLWLESDRMGFLLPALTSEKFEVQRETVKNERAQRIDNQPYGRLNERFNQAMYPAGHPYSWPVIGWPEDLERASVDDVRNFFKRWYGPNNATLTIGGDFDEMQTLAMVNKYFGELKRGPEVSADPKTPVVLDKTRYISMEDKVHLPLIYMGFPTVYARHKDEAALDLLANILGGGKTSLLYKNLVKDGYAVQASVGHPCQELACSLTLYALANPASGATLATLEQKINDSIKEFEQRGVTDDDLQKVKVQFEADTIFGMQSVKGKVSTLAYNQTFFDNPDMVASDLARYASVTKDDVMRVFNTYIKDKPMVVMSVVPEGAKQLIAAEDNFTPTMMPVAPEAVSGVDNVRQITSNFDRTIMPKVGDAPVLKVPELWNASLTNGIEVMGTESHETPTVELLIYLEGGHRVAPQGKAGVASLTASMLNESSAKRSTEELAGALEMLGSSVSFGASGSQSYIQLSSLTENLAPTLAILQEKLFTPGFVEADFQRLKQQQLQGLQHQESDPNFLARQGFSSLLYGENSPLSVNASGTLESVAGLTLEDVKQFYQQQYRAGNAKMVLVSDLSKQQVLPLLSPFAAWQGSASSPFVLPQLPELAGGTIYIIDKPDAAQSVINIGKRALTYDATGDYFKSYLMNYPLGGAFNSRINLNLREDKGYTYGARSGFNGDSLVGRFMASASVRTDVTAESLIEFINEINLYQQQGMSEEELTFLRSSISQGKALDYETPYQKAGFMRMIQRYQLDDNFTEQQANIVQQVSRAELNELAATQLDLSQMVMLIVGDKAAILPKLQALDYPIVEIK